MIYFAKIKKIDAETLKEEDLPFMSNTQIFTTEWGDTILKFESDDLNYVNNKWRRRTGATLFVDSKLKMRQYIELEVGDVRDRIADAFKFNSLLLFMVSELYKLIDEETRNGMDETVKSLFDNFISTIDSADSELFNIDLKQSYSDILTKLINREKKVTDIIKEINGEVHSLAL
jgi:hypothetical protein